MARRRPTAWLVVAAIALAGGCGEGSAPSIASQRRHRTTTTDATTTTLAAGVTTAPSASTPSRSATTTTTTTVRRGSTTTTAGTPSTTSIPSAGSGVQGTVTAGPTCPVERPDEPCPPRPVQATITATTRSGAPAGSTWSGEDGHYLLPLEAGHYTLTTDTGSRYPYCGPVEVDVPAAGYVTADIDCDTGIR